MGLIRLLLALAVVSAHFTSHPLLQFVGGEAAVQAFFIISGFYIAMIFPKNYPDVWSFWKARFFRLFPVYLFCGLFAFGHPIESLQNLLDLPFAAASFVFFTNATLLFQDATLFLHVQDDSLQFTPDFSLTETSLSQYLIVPQAWSLGLEISFYLIAPFIIKSWYRLLFFFAASLVLRVMLVSNGFDHDPWSYRFFPTELALFLLGSISYKVYEQYASVRLAQANKALALPLLICIAFYIFLFPFISWDAAHKKIVLYLLLALFVPIIFALTKDSVADNFIGNLSYPVYCCHLLILKWISKIPGWKLYLKGTLPGAILAMLVIIGFSYLLFKYIETPFDNYRKKFKKPA